MGAIGRKVPKGATYLYNLNFFCGFIVASGSYYLLCYFFPVQATSDRWLEVGDEVRNPSVAYDAEEGVEIGDKVTEVSPERMKGDGDEDVEMGMKKKKKRFGIF